ncbi:DNA mismatch repair endonuclease MutL [Vibrio europaeus]|uniref:DNA mismatch repair protein MutL n=1 Tax=Vibrio europaeus TaxID=300876 RepID=A0AAE7AV77_9VIBR|nr:DNA mismatch repair endonuclease MutL [Vibrio europaeus]MDC5806422.1 DNA mismatch repair endonuclease MutL [Vibrio europaeus]MDC5812725.1 DNA mismatch repair endonuclease MutL [Vibrio europaeus]MDC5827177.1 DNA mismatch repair endonuclease MutL [Vibrio europaeus]MDC5832543.1 DNA mismatch repair endonuclease MutL [Vibrio europaeus]MDC5836647.1 DNA mismatch repair endonuclease MutL [Vibrio europaeus]
MTIKILPARLANQIAAGEVVERPASVVKELVENSLDSGATRIDIDIEKGGAKLIRVRDNGKGIVKDELGLALSRHATSKIHTLDDLEAIISLGFRGEALASISSVARLTMTSRPATQEQAWSAYSEGREMQVKLQPAAHPIGTTVEVLDLFFNTPARRKFLRTEKTEFTHIDELLKRIALSRFDVTINLRHNGKLIKQYRAAKTEAQAEKRIAAVCGNAFVRNMLKIELEHQGLKLHGWITTPEGARQQSDLQYCYVNGRMMRDKLINHAIRQSYETSLRPDQFATYVLFIELDPHQVDVNVHPAKHEVRFHQARLVHDFIYQALSDALAQSTHIDKPEQTASAFHVEQPSNPTDEPEPISAPSEVANRISQQEYRAIESVPSYPGKADYGESRESVREAQPRNEWQESRPLNKPRVTERYSEPAPSKQEVKAYQELLQTPDIAEAEKAQIPAAKTISNEQVDVQVVESLGKAIHVVQGRYLVMADKQGTRLVNLAKAEWLRVNGQLSTREGNLKSQPLLVPLSVKLDDALLEVAQALQPTLDTFGIELKERGNKALMVMGVPQPLRQQNLQQLVPDLLSYAVSCQAASQPLSHTQLAKWLSDHITQVKSDYTLSEAIQIIADVEQLWQGRLPLGDQNFVKPVDFSATIAALEL